MLVNILHTIFALFTSLFLGHTFSAGGTISVTQPLDCSAAATMALYDTPSGFIQDGYYDPINKQGSPIDATSGKQVITAHVIGQQAVEICTDGKSTYTYPISLNQYTSFTQDTATLPAETVTTAQ